jgi:hypothetical protein
LQVDNDKEKGVSSGRKSISERLDDEVRDTKIKFLSGFNQETEDDKSSWTALVASLKPEYPKYTPLLAKILECIVQKATSDDKFSHQKEVINISFSFYVSLHLTMLNKKNVQTILPHLWLDNIEQVFGFFFFFFVNHYYVQCSKFQCLLLNELIS